MMRVPYGARKGQALALALFACMNVPAAKAADAPALAARVHYETRQVLSSGITRVDRWDERLVRQGDTVWVERIVPANAHHDHDEQGGHKHLDVEIAPRWVEKDAQGRTNLRLIDREHNYVVSVPAAEYGAVSFDGRWDTAACLVPPALARKMAVQASGAPEGASWRVQKAQGWTHKVLWADAKQIALRIESERDDGSFSRKVTVELTPTPGAAPWHALQRYENREYDDYLD